MDGIVDQDADELFDEFFVACVVDVFRDFVGILFFFFEGAALEFEGFAEEGVAQGEFMHEDFGFSFVGFGEGEEVVYESGHAGGLGFDVCDVCVFTDFVLEYIGVCADDGEGCFELVTGVRDESALVVEGFFDGADHPFGEEGGKECEYQRGDSGCPNGGSGELF